MRPKDVSDCADLKILSSVAGAVTQAEPQPYAKSCWLDRSRSSGLAWLSLRRSLLFGFKDKTGHAIVSTSKMIQRAFLPTCLLLLALCSSAVQAAQAQNPDVIQQIDQPIQQRRNAQPQPTPKTTLLLLPRFTNTTNTATTSTTHAQGPIVTLTSTSTPTSTPTADANLADSTQNNDDDSDDGLSSTARIGIGVGVGVGLTALLLGGFAWLWVYRKRVRESRRRSGGSGSPLGWKGWHTAF